MAQADHDDPQPDLAPPAGFQAPGPDPLSIQSTVDQFREVLGGINNGNAAGPLDTGRREINWDGGGSTATSPGTATLSFFGIVFKEPRIAFVRIITGRKDPSEGLDPKVDLVVMDDFIYGEPQMVR